MTEYCYEHDKVYDTNIEVECEDCLRDLKNESTEIQGIKGFLVITLSFILIILILLGMLAVVLHLIKTI